MKIVYLHQYFVTPAMPGGTRSYEFARRLVRAGHEVHVITSSRESACVSAPRWRTTNEDGIIVHWTSVPYGNRFGFTQRVRAFFTFAWRAAWRASEVHADLVFATSTPLTIALPAVFASRRTGAPLVFEVRDLWPEVPIAMGELTNRGLIWCARQLEKFAYRNSARIVALSPGMADGVAATGYPRDQIEILPNACDVEFFQSTGEKLKPGFLPPGDGALILYAGTFGRVNGVGYLVELAGEMLQLNPTIRFLLVGDGKERDQIEQTAKDNGTLGVNLWLRPQLRKAQMPALFRAATLATSVVIDVKELWHNSANKVFDALAAARPVVINHCGWQKDLLERSGAGFAVLPGNPQEAAQRIKEFLDSEDKVKLASQAAAALAASELSRDRLAERFQMLLEKAAGGASVQESRATQFTEP